jgi:hypothetical protein
MMEELQGNKSFSFGGKEFASTLKVFAWTVASALVVLLVDWLGMVEVPAQYAFAVPLANTVLYAIQQWIADNRYN